VSTQPFLVTLVVASGLLAAWFFVRFPRLAPTGSRGVTIGIVGTFGVCSAGPPLVLGVGQLLGTAAAIFLVAVPGTTYMFLAGIWVMAYVRRAIQPYLK
jgi:hypothetical protein